MTVSDERHRPSPLMRIWLLGLPSLLVVALIATMVFMRPPPTDGPWTRWDLFSLGGYGAWLLIVFVTWSLLIALAWAATNPQGSAVAPIFVCLIPGLLLVSVVAWTGKIRCPDQIPRDGMLDPLPRGSVVVSSESGSFRGFSHVSEHIRAGEESVDSLERRAADHYIGRGWQLSLDDGYTIELVAGDWRLTVSGQKDYSDRANPKDLDVLLYLSTFDSDCDTDW